MSSVVISGDTSGAITLAAPAVSGTNTITLPASTGTVITTGSPQSGSVLQVVQGTTSTTVSTTSTTFVTSGLAASITPKFSTSKILVTVSLPVYRVNAAYSAIGTLFRGTVSGTNLGDATWGFQLLYINATGGLAGTFTFSYLDSPATTSSTTYTAGIKTENSAMTVTICPSGQPATIILQEIAA